MLRKYYFISCFLSFSGVGLCQQGTGVSQTDSVDDYYVPSRAVVMKYDNTVYDKNIKSVCLYNDDFPLSQPLLQLGSGDQLQLCFDDLSTDLKNYVFTFIHCDAYWKPDRLMQMEYIDGYQEVEITDFKYSENTIQRYIHYKANVPSQTTHITKSGNYIVKVYTRDTPDQPIITRRLMVFDTKVLVKATVNAASIVTDRNFKQEIDFTIYKGDYVINDAFEDVKVFISQNNRWDNISKNLKPTFIRDGEFVYNYEEENVFTGGNEFRVFDTKSLKYKGEHISKIRVDSLRTTTNVFLLPDEKRTYIRYTSASDINGNFVIRTIDGNSDAEINADYSYVHFFLSYNEPIENGNLYVFGAFNGWQCTNENRMKYNSELKGYEAVVFLKQGYYNYEYAFLEDGKTVVDETLIEGMHSETENDYSIYVYNRPFGVFYDQLISIGHINSVKQ